MADIYDVAIIGAGPAGLTAAIYCGRSGLSTIVFGNIYDSQIAKAGDIRNYPGIESIQGVDLIEKFQSQAERYGIKIVTSNVTRAIPGEVFTLYSDVDEYRCRSVIVATGSKHRELNIPGEKDFVYKGVSYCSICDGNLYRGKPVAMVGSGDLAAKAALYLAGLCKEVLVLTEKHDMDSPMYIEQVRSTGNIRVIGDARVLAIEGREYVERIKFQANEGPVETADVDAIFIEGGIPNTLLAQELGLKLDDKGNIEVSRPDQSTNVEGVFAAGDVTSGIHQVSKAVGEGASAAMSAIMYVKKKAKK
ncbi:NAD(P)/FAD-dependent oxidoreductase [Methanocella conradii]|uniref:NAD(P)/FAD-dependent oxidoreductase n=1 Tax=Methanocella conradii TaxID=1175444 RepID=UPI0024B39E9E|nr:FAD-dependent oxidoreductase [Methanocella conradii]MDI6896565.1 FAD-dependent oxidoreductase [Methanocella conradii]